MFGTISPTATSNFPKKTENLSRCCPTIALVLVFCELTIFYRKSPANSHTTTCKDPLKLIPESCHWQFGQPFSVCV